MSHSELPASELSWVEQGPTAGGVRTGDVISGDHTGCGFQKICCLRMGLFVCCYTYPTCVCVCLYVCAHMHEHRGSTCLSIDVVNYKLMVQRVPNTSNFSGGKRGSKRHTPRAERRSGYSIWASLESPEPFRGSTFLLCNEQTSSTREEAEHAQWGLSLSPGLLLGVLFCSAQNVGCSLEPCPHCLHLDFKPTGRRHWLRKRAALPV